MNSSIKRKAEGRRILLITGMIGIKPDGTKELKFREGETVLWLMYANK